MTATIARIKYEGEEMFSPFSGQPVVNELGDPNEGDPTLLFVGYGMAIDTPYISQRLADQLDITSDDVDVEKLPDMISIDGAFVLEVDAGWNGVNYYGFAPRPDQS